MASKIAIIGSTGLVGSSVTEILKEKFEIEEYNSSTGFDITNPSSITALYSSEAEIAIHLAAKAHVDGCEEDKPLGKEGDAWKVNVDGVKNVAEVCEKSAKKFIYISTDFVFDGEKPVGEEYTEVDAPNPIDWYGHTKYEGEKIVQQMSSPWIIARIAYPYRAKFPKKKDFVRVIKDLLEKGHNISAVTDHIMCPTYIDDIALALKVLIEKNKEGIFHVVGSEALSPFDAVTQIAKVFDLPTDNIAPATREEYFKGKAPRPYNLALDNGKITDLGLRMKTFEEGLLEINKQLV